MWDEADYVVPPAENGAFFVTTNVVITPNQTWGECPEVGHQIFYWTIKFLLCLSNHSEQFILGDAYSKVII